MHDRGVVIKSQLVYIGTHLTKMAGIIKDWSVPSMQCQYSSVSGGGFLQHGAGFSRYAGAGIAVGKWAEGGKLRGNRDIP